jgi:manganese-dependent inorganic pyrophosphatase
MTHVVGHKNPDTDCTVSAVAYAALDPDEYAPFRAGELNDETLELFSLTSVDIPPLLTTLRLTAQDMAKQVMAMKDDATFLEISKLLEKQKIVPILTDEGRLQGIVAEKDLFKVIQRELFDEDITIELDPDVMMKTIPGRFLTEPGVIKGTPLILASSTSTVLERMSSNNVAIMGDRWDLLPFIIERQVRALILTMGLSPSADDLEKLSQSGVVVYSSTLHTFNTVRLLFMALPAKQTMNPNPIVVSPQDGLQYLRRLSNIYRHRYFPVVEEDGSFHGLLELADLASPPRKKVVLVDHNEAGQAVDGLEEAQILAIIDHHRVGNVTTDEPIKIVIEAVGSTSTLVAREYIRQEKSPSHDVATLLLGGIVSDTLNLQSVTTTPLDVDIAQYLEGKSLMGRDEIASHLFQARVQAILKDPAALTKDFKLFTFGKLRVGISQIEIPEGFSLAQSMRAPIEAVMKEKLEREHLDLALFMLTDITRKGTLLFAFGDKQLAQTVWARPFKDGYEFLPQVVSRKKQIVPLLEEILGSSSGS